MTSGGDCVAKATDRRTLAADRALLSAAVERAGETALRHFRADCRQWHKGPGQIVTEADIEIDRQLHDLLIGTRPEDGWLSEERRDDGSRLIADRVWIVDPIDGTRSFAEGVPEFTISVALAVSGEPVLASVFNPATGEHFQAASGQGASCDGKPLRPGSVEELAGARLLASKSEMKQRHWPKVIPEAEFTVIGSLAYKLALVAAGRFDGLLSLRPSHDWDLAAAMLLMAEAGGWLADARGRPLRLDRATTRHDGLVAAGTGSLYTRLLTCLETVRSS